MQSKIKIVVLSTLTVASLTSHALPVRPRAEVVNAAASSARSSSYVQQAVLSSKDLDAVRVQKVSEDRVESATHPLPDISGINIDQNEALNRGQFYDVVAVINKAKDQQNLTLYRFRTHNGIRSLDQTKTFKISTGREVWSCEEVKDKSGQVTGREARWTGTPTGFFNPYRVHPDHHSSAYDDADMYAAVFFNKLGIATHQGVTKNARASHGCVRMSAEGSQTVLKWTLQSGGPVNPNDPMFSGVCAGQDRKSGAELAQCLSDANARTAVWREQAQAAIDDGWANDLGPWDPAPQIPDINQDGSVNRDEAGQALMKQGYRALFVVECRTKTGADCSSSTLPPKPDCNGGQTVNSPLVNNQPQSAPRQGQFFDRPAPAGLQPMYRVNQNPTGGFF